MPKDTDGGGDFAGAPQINDDFTVTVPGHGNLSAGEIVHVIPGGAGIALKMKAAAAKSGPPTNDLRPFQRGRLSGVVHEHLAHDGGN